MPANVPGCKEPGHQQVLDDTYTEMEISLYLWKFRHMLHCVATVENSVKMTFLLKLYM